MKTLKTLGIAIAVLLATAAVAYGADQIRDRGSEPQHDQTPDKIQLQKNLKDGSGQAVTTDSLLKTDDATDDDAGPTQSRDRDQLRDGSCGECDGDGDGDGECTQAQDCSQTQTQTQTHDGNAWDDGDAGHEGDGGQGDGGQGDGGQGDGDCGDGGQGDGDGGQGGCGDGGH